VRLAAVRRLRSERSRRRPAGLATLVILALVVLAACGRPLPDDQEENAPPGGDTTGAFDVGGEEAAPSLEVAGDAELAKLVRAAGRAFEALEDVGVRFAEQPGEGAYAALCAGRVDVAATAQPVAAARRQDCGGTPESDVELPVARAPSGVVYLYTTRKALGRRFEVESFVQYVLDNYEQIAQKGGLQALSGDEIETARDRFEDAVSGL
jgi:ABC-type phosphate transport system substrate-binding protein